MHNKFHQRLSDYGFALVFSPLPVNSKWYVIKWIEMMIIRNDFLHSVIITGLLASIVFLQTACSTDQDNEDTGIVEFESVSFTYTPSPLKVRQAKKLGKSVEITTEPSVSLNGHLARPEGDAPRAAIVLLHTCAGISEHEEMWSKRLVSWGYVVLSVDSFKPRGFDYICDGRIGGGSVTTPWRRALDAYGAKRFLSTLSFVNPNRIAVIGMSHGGSTILEIIKQSTSDGLEMKPFQAAIPFYPLCSVPEPITTPTLILVGSEDNWTPAEFCTTYVEKLKPKYEITLKVFEGAHHAFDHPGIDTIDAGYIIRSNPKVADEASQMVRDFLEEHL